MTRRTQAERSATTREQLLQATIDCLVDKGYEGTSTTEICRRAGVSRGAQLHHYPTKSELLIAALEYLCDQRHAEFRALVHGNATERDQIEEAFNALWTVAMSPALVAWLELGVASRTDAALKDRMRRLSERVEEDAEDTLRGLLGVQPTSPMRGVSRMVLSLLDGLALRAMLQDEEAAKEGLDVFRALVSPWFKRAATS